MSNVKKFALRFVLLLTLCSLLVSFPQINMVEASGTIYIRSDGTVEGTDKIKQNGSFYTFTENIEGYIEILKDNITIDGAGFFLQGQGVEYSKGIAMTEKHNVTIKNLRVSDFHYGIVLDHGSTENSILDTYVTNSSHSAIWLFDASNNIIDGNTITNNKFGLFLGGSWFHYSDNNLIIGNTITTNEFGILMNENSHNNKFQNNSLINNKENFIFRELSYPYSGSNKLASNTIDKSNTVNNKPVYYWVNQQDRTVPYDAGWIALINCKDITVKNQHLSNNQDGILIVGTTNSIITNCTFSNNMYGITCISSGNTITKNLVTNNTDSGIFMDSGLNNHITDNYVTANERGINLNECSDNVFMGNNLTNNTHGIYLYHSPNNTIVRNQIQRNTVGLSVIAWAYKSSSDNYIYANNLIDNTRQVDLSTFIAPKVMNIWDNGFEGNYWSDYEHKYPNATEIDNIGIWNTPYVIDEDNQDNYPLMNPVIIPEFSDTTPPTISIVWPENNTYSLIPVHLNFMVNKSTSWIGYSLDGQANVTITGNTTITGLSEGLHSLVVYATDTDGNTGASETIYFTTIPSPPRIDPELFPQWAAWAVAVSVMTVMIVAVAGAILLVYFAKVKKTTGKVEK